MKQIIFDTDIGIDDAMALLFLHFANEVEILSIISGYGNASIERTTVNALYMNKLFNINAPIFSGASNPLGENTPEFPDFVHGINGLGDIDIPEDVGQPESLGGAQAIVDAIRQNPGKITIVSVGRLTNVALALNLCPELPALVKEIIIMGGAFGFNGHYGNVSPVAEANIAGDPKAADLVFTSGMPITVVGLDVTLEVTMEETYFDALRAEAGLAGEFIYRISQCYLDFHERVHGHRSCPVHDPSAVAYLLQPQIFGTIDASVRVVTEGDAAGQTICGNPTGHSEIDTPTLSKTSKICTSVDADALLHLYHRTLASSVN